MFLWHVDYVLIVGKDMRQISKLKKLNKAFEMKDFGQARQLLGIQLLESESEANNFSCQRNMLKRFSHDLTWKCQAG